MDGLDFDNLLIQEEKEVFDYSKHIVEHEKIDKDLENFLDGKIKKGYGTGFYIIDDHIRAKENEFIALTGKKGRGKTTIQQSLQLMWSIANGLIWVVAYQENMEWSVKLNLLNQLLGTSPNQVRKENPQLYNEALKWVEKHFIVIDVEDLKTATEVTKHLIKDGVKVHGLIIDPVNSFANGWQDTGNGFADGSVAARNMLMFTKKWCSIYISQHPTMSGQRQQEDVNSYQAEGGGFLNKASFTYSINRDNGSNINRISVDNVRNKHTGGCETDTENPILLEWGVYDVNVSKLGSDNIYGMFNVLRNKYKPLSNNISFDELPNVIEPKELPNISVNDAFGANEKDVPF